MCVFDRNAHLFILWIQKISSLAERREWREETRARCWIEPTEKSLVQTYHHYQLLANTSELLSARCSFLAGTSDVLFVLNSPATRECWHPTENESGFGSVRALSSKIRNSKARLYPKNVSLAFHKLIGRLYLASAVNLSSAVYFRVTY